MNEVNLSFDIQIYNKSNSSCMEKSNTFKFSTEEVRKMNHILPKGYKFVPREEIIKKDVPKPVKKPRVVPPQPPSAPLPALVSKPRSQKVKEDEYEPKVKIALPPPIIAPTINPNEPPAGTSQKLLERVKRHPAFDSLMRVAKFKESDTSLKEIQIKAKTMAEIYPIFQLETDLQNFCMMVYKNFAKTTTEYREAAVMENYLGNLMKIEKGNQMKKVESSFGLQRSNSIQMGGFRKKPQQVNRSVYQPLAESKLPTPAQKRLLGQMIKKLPSQSLQQVCYIVFQSTENRDYIFDLDTLHIKKFRELEEYVKKYMEKIGEWEQRTFEDEEFSNQSIFVIEDDD